MKKIGIGVIGTAFMGRAHSIAYAAAGSVFGDGLRPTLELICDYNSDRAEVMRKKNGFCSVHQHLDGRSE